MNPSVDDRLNSVLRALETVVLPALPANASLAQEQVMLAMGQLQIIQAQRDAAQGYEQEELDDIVAMARAVLDAGDHPAGCSAARQSLSQALANEDGYPRERSERVRGALDALLVAAHDESAYHRTLAEIILPLGQQRAVKDRAWFGMMGFDAEHAPG